MLNGIHFLLTYSCNFECDHCFLYCGPSARGVFSSTQLKEILADSENIESIDNVFFEGGEPFLYYPLLVEGIKIARSYDLDVGIVTNAYWATTYEDALIWLEPLKQAGVSTIGLSDDTFHYGDKVDTPPKNAYKACKSLGIDCNYYCIEAPTVETLSATSSQKGEPIVGGNTVFKGRAVETLTEGLPSKDWQTFTACKREELINPGRVHLDPFGNVHICQGVIIGNVFERPLSEIMKSYEPGNHPIVGPLKTGGPVALANELQITHGDRFIDECHFCFTLRKNLVDEFPEQLGPRQVYGL